VTSDSTARRDPLALVRWLDVALVVVTAPVAILAGAPALGVAAGALGWVATRLIGAFLEARAKQAATPRGHVGVLFASMIGRAWLAGLTIVAAGLAGEREDGLAAAITVLVAFTAYFILALTLRPERKTPTS
jgi:hypothetical protein